jgi:hypothetical protein
LARKSRSSTQARDRIAGRADPETGNWFNLSFSI